MTIKEAYDYWYCTARNLFRGYLHRSGLQVACWRLDEFYNHACWKYQTLKKRGDKSWHYEYARAMAYKSLYERVYPALGGE